MDSDGAMTPEDELPVARKHSKRKRMSSTSKTSANKSNRAKRRSRKRRSSTSSSSTSSSKSSGASKRRKKRKKSAGWSTKNVLKLLNSVQNESKSKTHGLSNNNFNNVVPEFDPSSKSQSIDSWVRKVNECASIYEWDQKQTIHFALQKLAGLAKKWFEALPSVIFSWTEWQTKLKKAFPNEQNYGRLLEEMLVRTSRHNENLREYFYDKLTLINQCGISGRKAVDCIIHGIVDKSVRNSAQALQCEEPEDLLNFLSSQHLVPESVPNIRKRNDFFLPPRSGDQASTLINSSLTCFNCRTKGHSYYKCPKPLIKCQKCLRVGHDNDNCKLAPIDPRLVSKTVDNEERRTLTISTTSD